MATADQRESHRLESHQRDSFRPESHRPESYRPDSHRSHDGNRLDGKGPAAMADQYKARRTTMRKTIDYNSSIITMLENRIWQRNYRDRDAIQPDMLYAPYMLPPPYLADNPVNAVTTHFVKMATNKIRCPIFCMTWTPEGRRLITGTSSGEFTLWNGLTFNFETILQAHECSVRTIVWSHNEQWMVTGDHKGYVKYWQSNMHSVHMFKAHAEACRSITFSPTDYKFASCSDDSTVKIWDFYSSKEESVLRGHGADVKCVDWHPYNSTLLSGSKDNQQPIRLWDTRTDASIATVRAHKSTVMDLKWNRNGNWFASGSRDHLIKVFDWRKLSEELCTYRGHKREVSILAWHPHHEGLLSSGGSDGSIFFWVMGTPKEVASIDQAHESIVWSLAWHPLGHILSSGSNDHTTKFWSRNQPGDTMLDKYNLNVATSGMAGIDIANGFIPGMAPEDRVESEITDEFISNLPAIQVPNDYRRPPFDNKRIPYSRPVPKDFQMQWYKKQGNKSFAPPNTIPRGMRVIQKLKQTAAGIISVEDLKPDMLIMLGKPIKPNEEILSFIKEGQSKILKAAYAGKIPEIISRLAIRDGKTFTKKSIQKYKLKIRRKKLQNKLPSTAGMLSSDKYRGGNLMAGNNFGSENRWGARSEGGNFNRGSFGGRSKGGGGGAFFRNAPFSRQNGGGQSNDVTQDGNDHHHHATAADEEGSGNNNAGSGGNVGKFARGNRGNRFSRRGNWSGNRRRSRDRN